MVAALDRVGFQVNAGERVAVVGESGSGKSVTAYALLGLLDPAARVTGGRIEYQGQDLLTAGARRRRQVRGREIAMIFQSPRAALLPIRTVGQQIGDVLRRHHGLGRKQARERTLELLARVRITDPARRHDAYPFQLSGGMCQRVLIALALACEPQFLIADEPTTGLDVTTQAAVVDLLRELSEERRMALLFITHDLPLATTACDRVLVMHAGQVVEDAPTAALISRPRHPYTARLLAAVPAGAPELRAPCSTAGTLPDPPLLQVTNLVKRFSAGRPASFLHAVDDVSFSLRRGESVGLVGESGCGKSTLVRLISRLLDASAGRVLFGAGDGGGTQQDLGAVPARRFAAHPDRARIQQVFQDPGEALDPRATACQAIGEPLRRLRGQRGQALRAAVDRLAAEVALPADLLGRFPHQLSGGQRARVGIARALALAPDLLILDEPTAALDVSVQAVILQLLSELRQRLRMTYLFVTHDLSLVRLLCDRVMVMYLGQIVEEGPVAEVFARPAHPYTRALLAAIPRWGDQPQAASFRLPGESGSPIDPPPNACRLLGRCPLSEARCGQQAPRLAPTLSHPAHRVSCHVARAGAAPLAA